jgi:oligogalacturonide lyase
VTTEALERRFYTRRAALTALALPLAAQTTTKGQILPADWKRFLDPATEYGILRLTDPAYASHLAPPPARVLARHSRSLVFASRRSGDWQAWRMDLASGKCRQLTAVAALRSRSVGYTADERAVLLWDGPRLLTVSLNGLKESEIAVAAEGNEPYGPAGPSDDGTSLFWIERRGPDSLLRRWRAPRGPAETMLEADGAVVELKPNPRRATAAWRSEDGALWSAAFDGTQRRRLETAPGQVAQFFWSADGRSLIYLLLPSEAKKLNSIREMDFDTRAERLVANTSQFVRFAPNGNSTVFVGASASLAAPYILLLLRSTRREFALCEHKASSAAGAGPVFSPDSRTVVYETDRQGQPALFSVLVDKLVEATDS